MNLAEQKEELRRASEARRRDAARATGVDAGARMAEHFLDALPLPAAAVVSGYWPIRGEIDPRPLLRMLRDRGHRCALPVVVGRGRPLVFREWRPKMLLEAAGYDISVPPEDAAEVTPGLLLVPMLAFDARGYRLGYGGGYYDRTITALRAADPAVIAVGAAFAVQEIAGVPYDERDARLDWVVTERGARRIA